MVLGVIATSGYSKKQVDKAGKRVRDVAVALTAGDPLSDFDLAQVEHAIEAVEWWRGEHARPLSRVTALLRYYAGKISGEPPNVTQRLKRFSTIVDKLQREPSMALSKMEDIAGVRAILPTQQHVNEVVGCVRRSRAWTIRRIREYVDGGDPGPKADGYRAVHIIVSKDGYWVEIQLRTPWQDSWAQSVEQDTRRLRAGLKFGRGPDDLRQYYAMISELLAMRERHVDPGEEFMEELAKLYTRTRVYFPDTLGENGTSS